MRQNISPLVQGLHRHGTGGWNLLQQDSQLQPPPPKRKVRIYELLFVSNYKRLHTLLLQFYIMLAFACREAKKKIQMTKTITCSYTCDPWLPNTGQTMCWHVHTHLGRFMRIKFILPRQLWAKYTNVGGIIVPATVRVTTHKHKHRSEKVPFH